MTGQDALPLPLEPPSHARADFLVTDCNRAAFDWIERWPRWPGTTLVLHGPPRSGRTHLAGLWRARSDAPLVTGEELIECQPGDLARNPAVAVDDAERAPEEALLHLYNCCGETGAGLLIVAALAPPVWSIALPDLASRLRAAPRVAIGLPDDELLAALMAKHFADRQVLVDPAVIEFLVPRMERSFAAAAALADRLDRESYRDRRAVTLPAARRVLAESN